MDGVLDELGDVRVESHGGTRHNTMVPHIRGSELPQ